MRVPGYLARLLCLPGVHSRNGNTDSYAVYPRYRRRVLRILRRWRRQQERKGEANAR